MNFQDAAALTTPDGSVKNIHNKNSDLLWSAVGYNVRYDGDSTQQTYTGKNKIRLAPLTTTASGINWVVTKDTISASGTASSNWSIPRGFAAFATPLPAGSYVFSIPSAIDKAFQLNMRDSNDTTYDYTIQAGNTYVSFTTSYEAKSFRFALKAGQGVETNVTMENKLQLEAGSTATAYEPYTGGISAPNPDYPQDVNVVKGVQDVKVTGKNLFSGYTKGIRINPTTGGVETNSTAASSDFIPLDLTGSNKAIFSGLPNTLYSLVAAYNSEKVFLGRTSAGSVSSRLLGSDSFTSGTPQGSGDVVFIRLSVYENSSAQGVIGDIDDANIQLELGDTATAYEPYQSQSYTVSLGSVELCKIGDYQDYIYKSGDDWYVHKATGKSVVDTSTITMYYGYSNIDYAKVPKPTDYSKYDTFQYDPVYYTHALCYSTPTSAGVSGYDNVDNVGKLYFSSTRTNVYVGFKKGTSLSNIQTALTGSTFYYPLATPTDTKITDSTLVGQLNAIHDWLIRYDYYGAVTGNLPIIINRTGLT